MMQSDAPAAPLAPPEKKQFLRYAAILLLICVLIGVYARSLNQRFYAANQPFFDSMSYQSAMHKVMTTGREQGIAAALSRATNSGTVTLPYLIAAGLSPFLEPTRTIGIGIQTAELALVLLSLFYYVTYVKKQTCARGLLMCLPIVATAILYQSNGGLSDFRMDLSLCLMFTLTAIWYLAAVETQRLGMFLLFGLSAGLACLFRATAPVYFLVAFGPLVLIDLATSASRKQTIKGFATAVGVAGAISLWFYILRFDLLYYYYFVWNTDANAHLPLQESIRHVAFVFRHVGQPAVWMILTLNGAILFQHFVLDRDPIRKALGERLNPKSEQLQLGSVNSRFHYRLLWLAVAPTAMLVFRGAGLNPFVCMPSALGLVLVLTLPFGVSQIRMSRPVLATASILFAVFLGMTAKAGWKDHRGHNGNSMAAHKSILQSIVNDAKENRLTPVKLAVLHVHYVNTISLKNVSLFDLPNAKTSTEGTTLQGVQLVFRSGMTPAAEAGWKQIEGNSDEQKRRTILEDLSENVDYLVVPTEQTALYLADHVSHNVINRHCPLLRKALLQSGKWIAVSREIRNSPNEAVIVYRRQRAPSRSPSRIQRLAEEPSLDSSSRTH